jgi:hypothetical protein
MTLGRPPLDVTAVDAGNPQAVLAFQVSQLLAAPPSGVKYTVVRPVHAISVGHKQGAEVVIKVSNGSANYYYERAYIATGTQPLFRAEATDTATWWEGGDDAVIEAVVQSLTFSR